MEISMILKQYKPNIGGVEKVVEKLINEYNNKSINCEIYSNDSNNLISRDIIDGISVNRSPKTNRFVGFSFRHLLLLNTDKSKLKKSIVHLHGLQEPIILESAFFCKINGIKFIITTHYHGKSNNSYYNLLLIFYKLICQRILNWSSVITCVSDYEKNLLLNDFNLNKNPITIPNGVNIQTDVSYVKTNTNKIKIIFIGRIEKYKGLDYIFSALKILDSRRIDYIFTIIGKGTLYDYYHNKIIKEKFIGDIRMVGNVSEKTLFEELNNSDVLILLSSAEAYGLVVADALSMGIPCIVSNSTALHEFSTIEGCIEMDIPADPIILADNIINLKGFEKNSRLNDTKLLNWSNVSNKYIEIYMELLNTDVVL